MVRLRWAYFRSESYQNSFAARTIMMTNVPKSLQSDTALSNLLASIGLPYPTTEVHIGRLVGSLPDLIEKHEETVRKLEHVLAKYLKDPNNVPAKRPTLRINKTMGMFGGEKVDAIDFYTMQINRLEAAIENWRERIAEKKSESYGFASLAAVPYAHAAAKSLKGKKPQKIEFDLAPEPRNILWKNLTLTTGQRARLSTTGFLYLVVLLFVNAVPLLAVALIAQMASFTGALPFLQAWENASTWSFNVVAGLVPPAISGLFGYFLPILMRKIAKYRGEQTRTKLDKVVTGQFFAFLVVSQFLIFSLIGIFITSVATVVSEIVAHDKASSIFDTLRQQTDVIKKQFLNMSNYWLTWLPLRMWMSTFDLAQGVKLVLVWIQKAFFGRTPRDVREYTSPPNFEYAIYYGNFLFVFAVGAIYGCLAPLVMIFTAVVFWVSLICYKYQFMYVAKSKVESGGQLWRVVVNRLLVCLILMQIVLMFVVSLDDTVSLADRIVKIALCVPPIGLILAFKAYCRKRFDFKYDWYIPDAEEMAHVKIHSGDVRHHRLQRRFGHPSLHQKLFTPMVHAKVKHLLPEVYRGRLEDAGIIDVGGRKMEAEEIMGGLKIAAVDEDQLEYDPKTDSDMQSVMSGTTMATSRGFGTPSRSNTDLTFANQYQAYLAGGNKSRTEFSDMYEMNDMRDSHENLLEKRSMHNLSHSHGRKGSVGTTLYSFNTPSGTPGLEYPPTHGLEYPQSTIDISQDPLTHHHNTSQLSIGSTGGYFGGPPQAPSHHGPRPSQGGGSPYYNSASQYFGNVPAPQRPPLRNQRSNGTFQGNMGQYTDSPPQISPSLAPVRMSPQTHRSRQPSAGSNRTLDQMGAGHFYNAAAMYTSPSQPPYQAPQAPYQSPQAPYQSPQAPRRQPSAFDNYQYGHPGQPYQGNQYQS